MAAKLMRAVQYSRYGGGSEGLQNVEVPVPSPKTDEVLLKVEAAALNPVDFKLQKGVLRPFAPRRFPYIPGTDVAGEVVDVGSGVQKFKPGDKVVASLNPMSGGALAEYAVSKENLTVTRPPEVSPAEAAALPVAALTAHQAIVQSASIKLDQVSSTYNDEPKKNILITAASGGVGHYAVQLAKLGNTHVTATCGARNLNFVKGLGADEVLDYKTAEGAALTSPSGKKYDYAIHCASGIPWSTFEPNLAVNGRVIDLIPTAGSLGTIALQKLTFSKKQLIPLLVSPKSENLEYMVNLLKEKSIKTVVDSTFPLSRAKDAWDRIVSGHATGKIIVEP